MNAKLKKKPAQSTEDTPSKEGDAQKSVAVSPKASPPSASPKSTNSAEVEPASVVKTADTKAQRDQEKETEEWKKVEQPKTETKELEKPAVEKKLQEPVVVKTQVTPAVQAEVDPPVVEADLKPVTREEPEKKVEESTGPSVKKATKVESDPISSPPVASSDAGDSKKSLPRKPVGGVSAWGTRIPSAKPVSTSPPAFSPSKRAAKPVDKPLTSLAAPSAPWSTQKAASLLSSAPKEPALSIAALKENKKSKVEVSSVSPPESNLGPSSPLNSSDKHDTSPKRKHSGVKKDKKAERAAKREARKEAKESKQKEPVEAELPSPAVEPPAPAPEKAQEEFVMVKTEEKPEKEAEVKQEEPKEKPKQTSPPEVNEWDSDAEWENLEVKPKEEVPPPTVKEVQASEAAETREGEGGEEGEQEKEEDLREEPKEKVKQLTAEDKWNMLKLPTKTGRSRFDALKLLQFRAHSKALEEPSKHKIETLIRPTNVKNKIKVHVENWRQMKKAGGSRNDFESWRAQERKMPEASDSAWVTLQKQKKREGMEASEEIYRTIKSILNKLTPEKFDKLSTDLLGLLAKNPRPMHVRQLTEQLFEKATTQHVFIKVYTELSEKLVAWLSERDPEMGEKVDPELDDEQTRASLMKRMNNSTYSRAVFIDALLTSCQRYFESTIAPPPELASNLNYDERYEASSKYKMRMLGNIKFVAEMMEKSIINPSLSHICADKLLSGWKQHGASEILEGLCVYLEAVGPILEAYFPSQGARIFANLTSLMGEKTPEGKPVVELRLRFMIEDVITLKKGGWNGRRIKVITEAKPETEDSPSAPPLAPKADSLQRTTTRGSSKGWGPRSNREGRKDVPPSTNWGPPKGSPPLRPAPSSDKLGRKEDESASQAGNLVRKKSGAPSLASKQSKGEKDPMPIKPAPWFKG